jgi:hypothetical protein
MVINFDTEHVPFLVLVFFLAFVTTHLTCVLPSLFLRLWCWLFSGDKSPLVIPSLLLILRPVSAKNKAGNIQDDIEQRGEQLDESDKRSREISQPADMAQIAPIPEQPRPDNPIRPPDPFDFLARGSDVLFDEIADNVDNTDFNRRFATWMANDNADDADNPDNAEDADTAWLASDGRGACMSNSAEARMPAFPQSIAERRQDLSSSGLLVTPVMSQLAPSDGFSRCCDALASPCAPRPRGPLHHLQLLHAPRPKPLIPGPGLSALHASFVLHDSGAQQQVPRACCLSSQETPQEVCVWSKKVLDHDEVYVPKLLRAEELHEEARDTFPNADEVQVSDEAQQ